MAPCVPDCSNGTPALHNRHRCLRRYMALLHCVILRQQNEADQRATGETKHGCPQLVSAHPVNTLGRQMIARDMTLLG